MIIIIIGMEFDKQKNYNNYNGYNNFKWIGAFGLKYWTPPM